MAFGSFDRKTSGAPMSEINMVPLIDVVLVLLVIFIVTAPLLTQTVKLDLPKATSNPDIVKPEKIEFAINGQGVRYWNEATFVSYCAAVEASGSARAGERVLSPRTHSTTSARPASIARAA